MPEIKGRRSTVNRSMSKKLHNEDGIDEIEDLDEMLITRNSILTV